MSAIPSKGLFESGKRALDSLLDLVLVRLELFGSELEGEKLRLFDALFQAAVGLVLISLALIGSLGFILLLFWEGYRLAALAVLTLAFGACGAWLLMRAREGLRVRDGGPFALTLGELRRDRDSLRPAETGHAPEGTPEAALSGGLLKP
jgi:uncharacterized membrane protein YqjE